jgi:F0F1-type ATP synthase membrane subunit b/b'
MSTSTAISRREQKLTQDVKEAKAARDKAERKWEASAEEFKKAKDNMTTQDRQEAKETVERLYKEYEKKEVTYNAENKELDELMKELANGQKRKRGKSSTI